MQIYLSSHEPKADLLNVVQQTLTDRQLQDDFSVEVLAQQQNDTHKVIDPVIVTAIVTVLVKAVGKDGAITEALKKDGAISQLVKALSALLNKNVEIKIEHKGKHIDLSGSAGHIEEMLKDILK
jgi:hypothetical protein